MVTAITTEKRSGDHAMQWVASHIKRCPISNTIDLIGKKFTVLILRNMLLYGQSRFNQFVNSIEGINAKTLSARLREMERGGLIYRKVYSEETPVRVEYLLTEKGMALKPVLEQLASFSVKYCASDIFQKDNNNSKAANEYFCRMEFGRKQK